MTYIFAAQHVGHKVLWLIISAPVRKSLSPGHGRNLYYVEGQSLGRRDWNPILSMLLEEEERTYSAKRERSAVHRVFPLWAILLLVVAITSPWLAISALLALPSAQSVKATAASPVAAILPSPAPASAVATSPAAATSRDPSSPAWVPGKKGPWGQIDTMPLALDVPVNGDSPPSPPCSLTCRVQTVMPGLATREGYTGQTSPVCPLAAWSDADLEEIAQYWGASADGGKTFFRSSTSLHRVGRRLQCQYRLPLAGIAAECLYRLPHEMAVDKDREAGLLLVGV